MNKRNVLIEGAAEFGLNLTDMHIEQLLTYCDLLQEWNQKMNLTAITNEEEIMVKHFLDSLSIVKVADLSTEKRLIDIGTGAGFPGLVLAIIFSHLHVTLLDSVKKKVDFLKEVQQQLQIPNIECIHGRAEEYAHNPKYREQFDVAVSRAVAQLSVLAEYCLPFVQTAGVFIAYKGDTVEEEMRQASEAFELLGGNEGICTMVELPLSTITHYFVTVSKSIETPTKYPRRVGMPSKKPLQ